MLRSAEYRSNIHVQEVVNGHVSRSGGQLHVSAVAGARVSVQEQRAVRHTGYAKVTGQGSRVAGSGCLVCLWSSTGIGGETSGHWDDEGCCEECRTRFVQSMSCRRQLEGFPTRDRRQTVPLGAPSHAPSCLSIAARPNAIDKQRRQRIPLQTLHGNVTRLALARHDGAHRPLPPAIQKH